jgi:hypothetical protein
MAMSAHNFQGQRGGSTLIGLLLGVCLGMLALIKWPHLEGPVRALLAEHDISLTTDSLQETSVPEGGSTQLEVIPLQEKTTSTPEVAKSAMDNRVADDRVITHSANPPIAEPTTAIQSMRRFEEPNMNSAVPIAPETREVWQPFSSESAAHAFATAVSEALGIELELLRRSDHKVVPVIRCAQQVICDDVEAEITAYLAGPTNVEIVR